MHLDETTLSGIDTTSLRPVLPQRCDWSSVIGMFMLNFGQLELVLTEILKARSKPGTEDALMKKSFHEKVLRLRELAGTHSDMVVRKEQWETLVGHIEAVRDLRNHISHGVLRHLVSDDGKVMSQMLSMIKDACFNTADAPKVMFEDLLLQNQILADVLGELLLLDDGCEGAYRIDVAVAA